MPYTSGIRTRVAAVKGRCPSPVYGEQASALGLSRQDIGKKFMVNYWMTVVFVDSKGVLISGKPRVCLDGQVLRRVT